MHIMHFVAQDYIIARIKNEDNQFVDEINSLKHDFVTYIFSL